MSNLPLPEPPDHHQAPMPPKAPGFFRRHLLFHLCVVIPTLLAVAYFGFYASDVYVSEASYVVRSPNKKSAGGGLGAMLGGAGFSGFSRAQEDVYTVSDYIKSRDALEQLDGKLDLENSWQSDQIDLLRRLDPFGWGGSKESLFKYYLERVTVRVDPISGITSLSASVFSAKQAVAINQLLLDEAERLVNVMNKRGRNDLVRFAENEVEVAEQKAKTAALAVSHYRNTESVVDPERQTEIHLEQVSRLQEELLKTKAQIAQLSTFAPDSPHPPALKLRAETLVGAILEETEKIVGGENSLASKAAAYERLALESAFAERQLASALSSLEEARNEAQRQLLYLETIAKPSLPDEAIYPKRTRGIITTAILGFVAWGILSMLIAGVREHQY